MKKMLFIILGFLFLLCMLTNIFGTSLPGWFIVTVWIVTGIVWIILGVMIKKKQKT
jgi:predicted membrane channel-forming protein YqfA (hemolysin III family)